MRCLIVLFMFAQVVACQEAAPPFYQRKAMNKWAWQSYADQSIENGIIAQHTLYPHHFIPDSAELNGLGRRDLSILSEHYVNHPGRLNARRGAEDADLYQARIDSIVGALAAAGVDTERVTVENVEAGGSGLVSEHCLVILGSVSKRPMYPSKEK